MVFGGLVGCKAPAAARSDALDVAPPGVLPAHPVTGPTERPTPASAGGAAAGEAEAVGCVAGPGPTLAAGWSLRGFQPGPELDEVMVAGPAGEGFVGVSRGSVCVSEEGARWRPVLGAPGPLAAPTLRRLSADGVLWVIAQGTPRNPVAPRVFRATGAPGDATAWEALVLPEAARAAGAAARVFTDGVRRVFVHTPTELWVQTDGGEFEGPRALPGATAEGVDACGETLIARARVGGDGFWHRSEDYGRSWRPFRLGAIGLEGESTLVRCLGWRGGIEAGRVPLPGYWSFDQGRTWQPARYDAAARTLARSLADDPTVAVEPPRCGAGFGNALVCTQHQRLVLVDADAPWSRDRPAQREIRAPAACDHVRLVDDRRVVAFGRHCGLYVSNDLGGGWRALATRADRLAQTAPLGVAPEAGPGRGGWIDARTAWRLDGGVWWTSDAGAHWRLVPTTGGRLLERGVFVDAARGVFARSDGWVVSTADGGRTWRFVVRGEVERIASAGPWVMVTTATAVRVSPDGGASWRPGATLPAGRTLDPTLRLQGGARRYDLSEGVRVLQQADRITVATRGPDGVFVTEEVVRALSPGYSLLAAHATEGRVDRLLLSGGAVVARGLGGAGDAGD